MAQVAVEKPHLALGGGGRARNETEWRGQRGGDRANVFVLKYVDVHDRKHSREREERAVVWER